MPAAISAKSTVFAQRRPQSWLRLRNAASALCSDPIAIVQRLAQPVRLHCAHCANRPEIVSPLGRGVECRPWNDRLGLLGRDDREAMAKAVW